ILSRGLHKKCFKIYNRGICVFFRCI
ncbi:hypothetical protein, partial [Plasmodium yoelii yoelii]